MSKSVVFISYRRDDSAGYAGRLEETLERTCGVGTVFRDVRDIGAGENFADVLRSGLSSAHVVLVLIGPRWAGLAADGSRRLDEERDFVRLEVASALASKCKVIPVLLSGTNLPRDDELPEPLKPLRRRQTLSLNEASWDADVERLVRALGIRPVGRRMLIVAGAAMAALVVGTGGYLSLRKPAPPPPDPALATAEQLLGTWQGRVRYGWGDEYPERFEFKRFAGEVTGTASFLKYPRGIEAVKIFDGHVSFETRSTETVNNQQERELRHLYTAELDGSRLHMRMQTTGGFQSYAPYEFTAERVPQSDIPQEAK